MPRVRLILLLCLAGWCSQAPAKEQKWVRIVAPDFTVLSPLREKEANAWATDFAQFVAALRTFFQREQMRLPPLTIVVFSRDREFNNYHPIGANGKPEEVGGFFARNETWAVAALSDHLTDEVRQTIFHEGTHWFLSLIEPQNPVWLEEGFAEVFSTFRIERKKQAEWGRAIPWHVELLRSERSLPLERLLFTGRGELFANDSLRTTMVYAESWAFVHFLLFGKHDIPRSAFADYAESMHTGVHPDEAFRKVFGRDYAAMDRLLANYVRGGAYFVRRQPLAAIPPLNLEPATTAEVEQALGRLALVAQRPRQAVEHGRALVAEIPDDPRGHELLGVALSANNDKAAARVEFEAAVKAGSKDFRPYFELALAEQNELVERGMGPVDARRIANRYEKAINLHPRFALSYENLAGVVGVAEPWNPEDRKFLELGARLFPDRPMIEVGLAQLDRRAGDKPTARARLDKVLAGSSGASMELMAFARRIDENWQNEDIFQQVDRLMKSDKSAEALVFIDGQLQGGLTPSARMALKNARNRVEAVDLSRQLRSALDDRRWSDARDVIGRILESTAPHNLKSHARQVLENLDQRKLGVEKAGSPAGSAAPAEAGETVAH